MKLAFKMWAENIQTAAYNCTYMVTVSIFFGLASTPSGPGLRHIFKSILSRFVKKKIGCTLLKLSEQRGRS